MATDFFQQHKQQLDKAQEAIASRVFYAAYPEIPSGKIYGETARKDGQGAFEDRIGSSFDLQQCGTQGTTGNECSPYGIALDVSYPKPDFDQLIE